MISVANEELVSLSNGFRLNNLWALLYDADPSYLDVPSLVFIFTMPLVAWPYSGLNPPVITSTSWREFADNCNPNPVPASGSWTETPSNK